jgi:hypothetical protein
MSLLAIQSLAVAVILCPFRSAALPETALSYRLTTTAGLRACAKDSALSCQQQKTRTG